MRTIKFALGTVLLAGALISCKNDQKEAQVEERNETEQQVEKDSADLERLRYAENTDTGLERPRLPQNYEIDWDAVESDPKMRADIEGWNDYNTFSASVKSLGLNEVPQEEITDYMTRLEQEANNLQNTIPASVMTEEVQEDIKDIREEVADLRMVLKKYGTDEKKIGNQVEELIEAYDDLNEELQETASKKGVSLLDDNQ
ncbi:hypothetical protein [Leeuwenhoekiella parthenopeia]|uniref:Lipoprotein n=1 Tax=Leeuwenhoekiella parthenopeia TaxID=2890320 RepID=A0ABS8GNR4_9FLAO|nr:hypothetical protein [Leeuwenhoekiella parthenopeia]MCC4211406.1 hypothetical protein [Leeuwenhoekiella parthenopeia]